ncbi:hypothetical protein Pyn_31676 [Prunus yedoensis var. nudiflora]|uniref:Uncharacterized protein n=1 Tax=Prunus yedoensis var. nudiflora TaxID=2094558 RepID=A0A314XNR7_PRUYE|nr:hypothetical protein Pyn_31676 [Prunus yedoensis var. nudiflora]
MVKLSGIILTANDFASLCVVAFVWAVFCPIDLPPPPPPPPPPPANGCGRFQHTVEHGLPIVDRSLLGTVWKIYNNYISMALLGFIMALCVNLGDEFEEKQPNIISKDPITQD